MKAKFVLLMLLLPIFSTVSVSAQIPTAAISVSCAPVNFEYDYIYDESLSPKNGQQPTTNVTCTASNPTQYQEKISITVIAPGLATAAPGDIYVGGGQDIDFQVAIRDSLGKNYYQYICDSCVEIIAKVEEIQSAPPSNNATSVNILGIKVNSMIENSTIGIPMPALDGQIYNGQQWDNYDYSMLFNDSSSSPFEQPWTAVQFMATDCPYCHSVAADMYEWSNLFDPTNQTNDNPKVNFFASATKLNTEATMELSWTGTNGTESNGTVVFELFDHDAPMHVENFAILAENGDYDGTVFHRIMSNFVMQGGDFTSGDGTGGHAGKFFGFCDGQLSISSDDCSIESYTVPDEADNGRNHLPYSLSMAKTSQPNTGGSQFFIVDPDSEYQGQPGTPWLDGVHTVFGKVTSGFEHIDAITALCDNQNCQNDKTPQDVVLESVTTNFFQGQSDIVSFRDSYNHSFPYIDDLDNDNMNSWNILGMPSYSLIQPNEIIAWDPNNPTRYWNHSTNTPSTVSFMECGFLFCDLEYMIYKLVDHNVSINGSLDSDGDGVIDEEDEFPNDANETHDDDGDGVGNNTDAFPQDGNETHDDDNDGVGNNTDAFPQDANETMDTDGDGVGDNADVEPDNPDVRYSDDIKVEISDTSSYIIAGAIVFLALVILFVRRKQPPMTDVHSQFAYEESLFKDN